MKNESELEAEDPNIIEGKKSKTGMWRKGTKPTVNKKECNQCMVCFAVCPHSAIRKIKTAVKISHDVCTGCMICLRECPEDAIKEERE